MPPIARLAVLLALGLAGCAAQEAQNTERLLSAAGFQVHPADTPTRQESLATLPPNQLVLIPRDGRQAWVYSDPVFCHCLYVGGPTAYQAFERLSTRQQIARTQLQAAQLNSFDSAWGPWPGGAFGLYSPWVY